MINRHIIKKLLDINKLTLSELSRKIGIPQPTLHRVISGNTPDPKLSIALALSKYLNVSVEQLSGESLISLDEEKVGYLENGIIALLNKMLVLSEIEHSLNQIAYNTIVTSNNP